LEKLGNTITAFVTSQDVKKLLTPSENAHHQQLADVFGQLTSQGTYTSSFQSLLAPFKSGDLAQLETVLALIRTYLQTTLSMDSMPGISKLGIAKGSKAAELYIAIQTNRKALRESVDGIGADQTDELAALVDESAVLASSQPVDVDKLLAHLREAHKMITRLRVDEVEQDDTQISQLIENWQAALTHLPKTTNDTGSERARRAAVTKTLALHDLLVAIYGLLSGDVNAAAPLDLAIL
jgi:hypothetical protein